MFDRFLMCSNLSLNVVIHTFALYVTGAFYLHIRHETFLNPPAVLINFIQILQLIVVTATHFQNLCFNSFFDQKAHSRPQLVFFCRFHCRLSRLLRASSAPSVVHMAVLQQKCNDRKASKIFFYAFG